MAVRLANCDNFYDSYSQKFSLVATNTSQSYFDPLFCSFNSSQQKPSSQTFIYLAPLHRYFH